MKEEIKLFLQKAAEDEELQQKLAACRSPEEAYALASSVQDGFTFEEFVETMTKMNDIVNNGDQELSDEDLAMAAGGMSVTEMIIASASVISVIGGGYAAAAAA